jgi:hypothetical protein
VRRGMARRSFNGARSLTGEESRDRCEEIM